MERVVATTPPPPKKPACQGCTARVEQRTPRGHESDVEVKYASPKEAHQAAEELSIYSLEFQGDCDYLTSAKSLEREEL